MDANTKDRLSCLPVHVQALMQLYHAAAALVWPSPSPFIVQHVHLSHALLIIMSFGALREQLVPYGQFLSCIRNVDIVRILGTVFRPVVDEIIVRKNATLLQGIFKEWYRVMHHKQQIVNNRPNNLQHDKSLYNFLL